MNWCKENNCFKKKLCCKNSDWPCPDFVINLFKPYNFYIKHFFFKHYLSKSEASLDIVCVCVCVCVCVRVRVRVCVCDTVTHTRLYVIKYLMNFTLTF